MKKYENWRPGVTFRFESEQFIARRWPSTVSKPWTVVTRSPKRPQKMTNYSITKNYSQNVNKLLTARSWTIVCKKLCGGYQTVNHQNIIHSLPQLISCFIANLRKYSNVQNILQFVFSKEENNIRMIHPVFFFITNHMVILQRNF